LEHLYDVEKDKTVSGEFRELYKDKPIRPIPFEAVLYNLTQLFHCTPSQILDEDNNLIMDILTIHNTYHELEDAYREMDEQNRKNKVNMKMSKHIIIGLELEKLKRA